MTNNENLKSLKNQIRNLSETEKINPLLQLGDILETEGEYSQAMDYYNQALEISEKIDNPLFIAESTMRKGIVNWCVGDYDEALAHYLKALKIYEDSNDLAGISGSLSSIGVVYYRLHTYDKALEYYEKSLAGFVKLNDKDMISKLHSYIGNIHRHTKKYPEALENYRKSLEMSEKLGLKKNMGYVYTNIGRVYKDLGSIDKALEYFILSLEVREKIDHKRGLAITLNYIAEIYIKQKKYDEASVCLDKSMKIADKLGTRMTLRESCRLYAELSSALDDFKNAFKYYRMFTNYKDSIINEQTSRKIAELQTKYETVKKEKEAEIYRLKNIELVKANELLHEKNKKISSQKKELEELNKELHETNATKDKFFSIIAHDLRAPINSILSFVNMINMLSEKLSKNRILELTRELNNVTKNASVLLENLLYWSRSQTNTLKYNPELFNLRRLADSISELMSKQAEQKEVSFINLVESHIKVFADPNMLSAVLRNLIGNSIKFTPHGGRIILSSESEGSYTKITVTDTGVGMSEDVRSKLFKIDEKVTSPGTDNEKGFGLGLILCKEFAQKMGGEIEVESEIGKGSVFTFRVPNSD